MESDASDVDSDLSDVDSALLTNLAKDLGVECTGGNPKSTF